MASNYIDGTHLRKSILPRLNQYIWSAEFAPERFYVQRVFVCAAVISQVDEAVIHDLLKTMPSWSTTQENLDWQPDDERRSTGDVYTHLSAMSSSSTRDSPKPDQYLFKEVESGSNTTNSMTCSHSFRLSSLEICNAAEPNLGYHFGATALQNLPAFEGYTEECENWRKLLLKYIVEEDNESPYIVWGSRRAATAVVWQVQLDIVDTLTCRRSRPSYKRRRYGPMAELPAPAEKRTQSHDSWVGQKKNKVSVFGDCKSDCKSKYTGVRHRDDRGLTCVWTAETRLPKAENMRNKVSFGDYKSDYEAARAIDAAYYYYRKGRCNFDDSPEHLQTQPCLDGLEGKEKLKAVKERAKWLAACAPLPSSSPPSSPAETMAASPGFSRSNSGGSDESAVDDGITPDHMIDNNLLEPFEFNLAVLDHMMDNLFQPEPFELNLEAVMDDDDDDHYCEERTHCDWIFDESSSTQQASATSATSFMFSTAIFPSQYDNCCIMGDWGDASATHQSTPQASQVSIVAGSRL